MQKVDVHCGLIMCVFSSMLTYHCALVLHLLSNLWSHCRYITIRLWRCWWRRCWCCWRERPFTIRFFNSPKQEKKAQQPQQTTPTIPAKEQISREGGLCLNQAHKKSREACWDHRECGHVFEGALQLWIHPLLLSLRNKQDHTAYILASIRLF